MDTTTVGVDLAKSRFELAVADGEYRIQRRARLTRTQFAHAGGARPPGVLIEVSRCAEIRRVPVKSIEQQSIQQLHRLRAQCMGTWLLQGSLS